MFFFFFCRGFDDVPFPGLVDSPGMSYVRLFVMDLVRRGDGS